MLAAFYAAFCASVVPAGGQPSDACNKAMEAASLQSGFAQTVQQVQSAAEGQAQVKINRYVAKDVQGVAATAYVIGVKKQINFTTGILRPVVPSTAIQIDQNATQVRLTWTF